MVVRYVKVGCISSPVVLGVTVHPPQLLSCQQKHQVAPVLVQRESHLIDALHPALFQVRLGAQEVGVLGVVRRLLEIDIDAVCGAECRYWREKTGSKCYLC